MKEKKIQWHPAFCSAVRLVFQNETAHLEYIQEHGLNSKPILIDLLVIKKPSDCQLDNSLGRLFRGYNIMEYKSPGDAMNVDTYYKAYAYACLYKAGGETVNAIRADDITISLVRDKKPEKLIRYFKENGFQVLNPYPGIYHIRKDGLFDTQVIVTSELSEENQIWLRALAPDLEKKTTERFLEKATIPGNQGYRRLVDSVLEVVMAANQQEFEKWKGDGNMCEALRELMADEIAEALDSATKIGTERGLAEGRAKGLAEGRAKGLAEGRARGLTEGLAQGLAQGENRMGKLMKLLYKSGKEDEAEKALEDRLYREKLFMEFNI